MPDSPRPQPPDQSQALPASADTSRDNVSTPEPDGARVAEAGHGYVGRMMDDDLKATPRERDGDRAVDEEGAE